MPSPAVCTTSPFSSAVVCSAFTQVLLLAFLTRTEPSIAVKFACCGPALICCAGGGVPAHFDSCFWAASSMLLPWFGKMTYIAPAANRTMAKIVMITLRYVIVVQPIIDSDLRGDTDTCCGIAVRLPQEFRRRDKVIHPVR